jgi:hypothetical protein
MLIELLFNCLFIMFDSRYQKGVSEPAFDKTLPKQTIYGGESLRIFYYLKDINGLNNFVVLKKGDNQGLFPDSAIHGGVPVIFLWWQFLPGQLCNQGCLCESSLIILPIPEGYLRL